MSSGLEAYSLSIAFKSSKSRCRRIRAVAMLRKNKRRARSLQFEENFHATRLAIWRARSAVGTRSPGSGNETSRREWHYFRIDEELFFW